MKSEIEDFDKLKTEAYDYFKQYIDNPKATDDLWLEAVERCKAEASDAQDTIIRCTAKMSGIYQAYNEFRAKKGLSPV